MTLVAREFRHFPEAGVSLAVDVKNQRAQVSICSANLRKGDTFSRVTSRKILDLVFDGEVETLRAFGIKRRVFSFPYQGTAPRKEILHPLAQKLKEHLEDRRRSGGAAERFEAMLAVLRQESKERQRAFYSNHVKG